VISWSCNWTPKNFNKNFHVLSKMLTSLLLLMVVLTKMDQWDACMYPPETEPLDSVLVSTVGRSP
jgi:hypothetical protein